MTCKCGSTRFARVFGKCNDAFCAAVPGGDYDGYVPHNLNIGGGDTMEFKFCMECGTIQADWPLAFTATELYSNKKISKEEYNEQKLDGHI